MLFPTLPFLLFFAIVLLLATALQPHDSTRKIMLLIASYWFYAQWNWRFCFLLAGSSVWTWLIGLWLSRTRPGARQPIVALGVTLHLLLLGTFKYYDFFIGSTNHLLHDAGIPTELPLFEIILPVGISFFTFHGISYIVDVKRGDVAVCRRLADMLLYLSFFPQLVAGPIVRASFFLPQLYNGAQSRIAIGPALLLIIGGLFKKVVVASYLATELVDPVFFDPASFSSIDLLTAIYGYAIQIYCDFSAYTDMAIGLAALLGYAFPPNFNQPYRAQSLQDFWRRWHISLSSWLRDYLYKPLGGSRGSRWFTARNLAVTMLLGGVWHGAAWNFVIWGALHGAALIGERLAAPHGWAKSRPGQILATIATFHFVCFAWVFFRAHDAAAAITYLSELASLRGGVDQLRPATLGLIVLGLALQFTPRGWATRAARSAAAMPDWALGAATGLAIVVAGALGSDDVAPFIYFQF